MSLNYKMKKDFGDKEIEEKKEKGTQGQCNEQWSESLLDRYS